MSKYTTEVRFICEELAGLEESADNTSVDQIIHTAAPLIFTDYPIFDEQYRSVLNEKILKHFYTREIGYETYGLWKLHLNERMGLIMPVYNKMYEAFNLEYNILHDTDYTDTHNSGKNQNDTSSTNSNSTTTDVGTDNAQSKYSDTPQGGLTGLITDRYLTNARIDANSHNNTLQEGVIASGSLNSATTENYARTVVGKRWPKENSVIVRNYIDNLVNVDARVINELRDLFMNLW